MDGKVYRLLSNLNKKRIIRVKTAVGMTEEEEVGEGLSQGGIDSAILSAGSLDQGVNTFFKDSSYEINLGRVRMQPLL